MKVELRRLNDSGLAMMEQFHARIYYHDSKEDPPSGILTDDTYSEPFLLADGSNVFIEATINFDRLFDLGRYLTEVFTSREDLNRLLEDVGVGAWITLLYFDQICERKEGLDWSALQKDRYIPDMDKNRYYRHHIFNSALMYSTHGDASRILLYTPPSKLSEFGRFLSEFPDLVLNPEMIKVVDGLYWDEKEEKPKPGAVGSKKPHVDGALRRFAGRFSFYFQHDPTWDFWAMEAETIWQMLPDEFDRWKTA